MKNLLLTLGILAIIALIAAHFYHIDLSMLTTALPLVGMSLISSWEKKHGQLPAQVSKRRAMVRNVHLLQNPWDIANSLYAKQISSVVKHGRPAYFRGSYQANDQNKCTYHPTAVSFALFQELGEMNITQMSSQQANAVLAKCVEFVDDCNDKFAKLNGRKRPACYNIDLDRIERGAHWNTYEMISAQWEGDTVVIVGYPQYYPDKKRTLFKVDGNGTILESA